DVAEIGVDDFAGEDFVAGTNHFDTHASRRKKGLGVDLSAESSGREAACTGRVSRVGRQRRRLRVTFRAHTR
ncbi:MAG: hypothetical protein ACXW2I_09850, partial [Burkholderiales bacterium]